MASKKITLALMALGLMALMVGCSSDDDSPAAPVVDTAPPALPGNVAVELVSDEATVTWDANVTDADLAGYLVSRGSYDNAPEALVTEPQAANSYADELGECCGRQVTYYIYSVDTSDNVSAAATVTLQLPAPAADRGPERERF